MKKFLSCSLAIILALGTTPIFAQDNSVYTTNLKKEYNINIQPRVDIDMEKVFNDWKNLPGIAGDGYNAFWKYDKNDKKIYTTANVGFTGFYNPDLMKFTTGKLEYQMYNHDGDTGGFIWGLQKNIKEGKDVYSFYIYEECGAHNKWTIARIDEWIPAKNNISHIGPLFHGKIDYDWNKNTGIYADHNIDVSTVGASANFSKGKKLAEGDLPDGSKYLQKHKVSIEINESSTKISLNDIKLEELNIPVKAGSFGPVSCSNPGVDFYDFKMEAAPDNTALTTDFGYKVDGELIKSNEVINFGSKIEIVDNSTIDSPATIVNKEWIVKKDGNEIYRGSTPFTGYIEEGKYETTLINTGSNGLTGTVTKEFIIAKKPIINIPDNIIIIGGDKYNKDDLKQNVTATDKDGKDISDSIVVDDSKVNPNEAGEYDVTYKVTDEFGITTEITVPITVKIEIDGIIINKIPEFNVKDDITITSGSKFDPKDLINDKITATDKDGKDITNKIEVVDSKVDPNKPGEYDVTYKVTDDSGASKTITIKVTVEEPYSGGGSNNIDIDRIEGNDRIDTAIETSKELYPLGTPIVVLANAERYTDVLTANPFAIQENGAALLTYKDSIPKETLNEIKRLNTKKIYISGGYDAVSKKVVDQLANMGYSIYRFDGKNRYDTARKIAIKIREKGNKNIAELASGEDFPDALCMTPLAVKDQAPILLTKKDSIPIYTKQALAEWDIENIKIAGLDKAVSKDVEEQIKKGFSIVKDNKKDFNIYNGAKSIKRIGGLDRYETSAKIAKESYPNSKMGVYATGEDFPDALIAGNYAGRKKAPVLLVKKENLPSSIEKYNKESVIKNVTIIGGYKAINRNVVDSIKNSLK